MVPFSICHLSCQYRSGPRGLVILLVDWLEGASSSFQRPTLDS